MWSQDDSFSAFDDFCDLTDEDFAKIDALVAERLKTERTRTPTPDLPVFEQSFRSDIDGINFSLVSPEEFARLDEEIAALYDRPSALPAVAVELEDEAHVEPKRREPSPPSPILDLDPPPPPSVITRRKPWHLRTPMEQFRTKKIFSVTDLASPLWCEVQFDYGLRGKRSRPLNQRPKSFKSSSGKTIRVEQTASKDNDVRTKQGLAVHKVLEREIRSEELKVDIVSEETRWALRLVNMIACFDGILTDDFTREMPIFGIMHDEIVVGIIDELWRGPFVDIPTSGSPESPPSSKRASEGKEGSSHPKRPRTSSGTISSRRSSRESSTTPPSGEKAGLPGKTKAVTKSQVLYIKDNKTRGVDSVPPDEDTESGRIQLMIYRRLTSDLISTGSPYDFQRLWDKLGLESKKAFPTSFLLQAGLGIGNDDSKTLCLDDLVDSWHKLVAMSGISGVHPQLELVYRLRPSRDGSKEEKDAKTPDPVPREVNLKPSEDDDLNEAIHLSLKDLAKQGGKEPAGESASIPSGLASGLSEEEQLQWAVRESLQLSTKPNSKADTPAALPAITKLDGAHQFPIIGVKSFLHNDEALDEHISQVLRYWHGEREPQGVPESRSRRCNYCEYAADCEWRASKALEYETGRSSR